MDIIRIQIISALSNTVAPLRPPWAVKKQETQQERTGMGGALLGNPQEG